MKHLIFIICIFSFVTFRIFPLSWEFWQFAYNISLCKFGLIWFGWWLLTFHILIFRFSQRFENLCYYFLNRLTVTVSFQLWILILQFFFSFYAFLYILKIFLVILTQTHGSQACVICDRSLSLQTAAPETSQQSDSKVM